jgi:putative membrane protein
MVISALAVCVLLVSAQAAAQKLDNKDTEFIKEAAQGSMLEVKLGELAEKNATSEDVKKFAKRMADDHGKCAKDLMSLASNKGVTLSKDLDKKSQETVDKLSKMKGADFDKAYMRAMVEDHETDVNAFKTASKNLTDPDLKTWALKTLPTLEEHLKLAKDIRDKIDKAK